ncbi:uncharacterized protein [Physcomitrium patens]|uniref:uncharacterized protein isoform X2 n=1 Tax=Physcomitrium patens TaxID=3218 RepID=UPI000D151C3B|nr:armadillo repeat-containing protein 6-like isoform X2 [Physcomitrium patens]|eukprot:XP_024395867.1 armadillo repeat-containing protein 6-like isoform X2 [Physcomitrella patens]
MAPSIKKMTISQESFDAAVKENMDDFDMDLEEAVQDAVQAFKIQGVDLSGIIIDGSNIGKADYVHPVVEALKKLDESLLCLRLENGSYLDWEIRHSEPEKVQTLFETAVEALEKVAELCKGPENAQIAVKHGVVEASLQSYHALKSYRTTWASLALRLLLSVIAEEPGKEVFLNSNGPQVVLEAIALEDKEPYDTMIRELSCTAANVIAVATTKNEKLKECFMDLGADRTLVTYLKFHAEEMGSDGAALQAACDAIRSMTVADDDRVPTSNAFRNAMKIAKLGAIDAFLEIMPQKAKTIPLLASLCFTLKSLCVNDELCKHFAEEGGLDMVIDFLDYACKYPNKIAARQSFALLCQLAGSDANKEAIVKMDGLKKIIRVMQSYNEEPSVLQEGFAVVTTLTLRSPLHATKAVEAGALDLAAEMMEAHSNAPQMLRQACQMVRNLNVRNPENSDKPEELVVERKSIERD